VKFNLSDAFAVSLMPGTKEDLVKPTLELPPAFSFVDFSIRFRDD